MFRICTTFESGLCIRSKIKLDQIKVKRLHNSTIEIVKSEKDNQSIHAFSKSFFFLKEHGFAISYYENWLSKHNKNTSKGRLINQYKSKHKFLISISNYFI